MLCDIADPERGFADFETRGDAVVLLINNYGGLSNLELGALADEVLSQLGKLVSHPRARTRKQTWLTISFAASKWSIEPVRTFSGAFETSLNAPGFSISLANISAAARQCNVSANELLGLLDLPTAAVSWPNQGCVKSSSYGVNGANGINEHRGMHSVQRTGQPKSTNQEFDLKVDPALLNRVIRAGCEAAIASEPKLTQWDLIMGDGDCGEAVKGVCEGTSPDSEAYRYQTHWIL